jgi:anaerobic glycerol-3-phosphate dehydrogenase
MAPEAGSRRPDAEARSLSAALNDKIVALHMKMDENHDSRVTRQEAVRYFKKFGQTSANAMFDEVDHDKDGFITLEEFRDFWKQVKASGYTEDDINEELDELLQGHSWVNYQDERDVNSHSVEARPGCKRLPGYTVSASVDTTLVPDFADD